MNNARRRQLQQITAQLEDIREQIETLVSEEEEARDAMPESLQASNRGARMEEIVDQLNEAASGIEDAVAVLNEAAA
ncbi:hypothetical protein [Pseudomonas aeruginosa]|uniref:hypothetical protein n=1 Tax=Pseudomonas aeruginosa TaxID=287 RepID=UPI001240A323|nr:hypothetical protein [Pseudomonas aeruginosa]HCT2524575.1 hypothetical protein [Pseudomonas aeruginosa]